MNPSCVGSASNILHLLPHPSLPHSIRIQLIRCILLFRVAIKNRIKRVVALRAPRMATRSTSCVMGDTGFVSNGLSLSSLKNKHTAAQSSILARGNLCLHVQTAFSTSNLAADVPFPAEATIFTTSSLDNASHI